MSASDIRVDVGEDQIIIGANCRGARISVLVDGTERVDDHDLKSAFAELGQEVGHYTFVSGSLLEKRDGDASPELLADGDGKSAADEQFEDEVDELVARMEAADDQDPAPDGGVVKDGHRRENSATGGVGRHRVLSIIFALVVALHGPIDVLLTATAWQLEANPVVPALGLWPWVAVKTGVLAVATLVWWDAPRFSPRPYVLEAIGGLGLLAGFGLGLVYQNLVLLWGVLG